MRINADGVHYRDLNSQIHVALEGGENKIAIHNARGQRYIGAGLNDGAQIVIDGVPGNDLGAFMNGAEIVVNGNAQDGVGNTMNAGTIVVHGDAGDILGHAMRGGNIFVRGRVGYRAGIHMKAYRDRFPIVVVGGHAGDYLGEYMAGGMLVVLGSGSDAPSPVGKYVGTGMHGGVIYLRGQVEPYQLGREVGLEQLTDSDWQPLSEVLAEYNGHFGLTLDGLRADDFVKLTPQSARPYGKLYAY